MKRTERDILYFMEDAVLSALVHSAPEFHTKKDIDETWECFEKLSDINKMVMICEQLDSLHTHVVYHKFDVEAGRREIMDLVHIIEGDGNGK